MFQEMYKGKSAFGSQTTVFALWDQNMKHKTTANLAHDSKNCQRRTAPLEVMVPA